MHIVNLGVDLWIAGSIMKTIVDDEIYTFWGDGGPDQQLVVAYQKFKSWARSQKWQCLSATFRVNNSPRVLSFKIQNDIL